MSIARLHGIIEQLLPCPSRIFMTPGQPLQPSRIAIDLVKSRYLALDRLFEQVRRPAGKLRPQPDILLVERHDQTRVLPMPRIGMGPTILPSAIARCMSFDNRSYALCGIRPRR